MERITEFLQTFVNNPERQQEWQDDPEDVMDKEHLPEGKRKVLRTNHMRAVGQEVDNEAQEEGGEALGSTTYTWIHLPMWIHKPGE
jgi:hypothetical protein